MKLITAIFFAFVAIVAYLGDVSANVATTSKEEAPLLKESSATLGMYLPCMTKWLTDRWKDVGSDRKCLAAWPNEWIEQLSARLIFHDILDSTILQTSKKLSKMKPW